MEKMDIDEFYETGGSRSSGLEFIGFFGTIAFVMLMALITYLVYRRCL
jgi:hypothetical protein